MRERRSSKREFERNGMGTTDIGCESRAAWSGGPLSTTHRYESQQGFSCGPVPASMISASPIEWDLFYTAIGSKTATDATSLLESSPTSNSNSFKAGNEGIYNVTLLCPLVAAATGKVIYAGDAFTVHGPANVWLWNKIAGVAQVQHDIHFVLIISKDGTLSPRLEPFSVPAPGLGNVTITSQGSDGHFDFSSGSLNVHAMLELSGGINGTSDLTLSTDKTITPWQGLPQQQPPVSGHNRDDNGQITLVGDAPINGPTDTTHCWVEVLNAQMNEVKQSE